MQQTKTTKLLTNEQVIKAPRFAGDKNPRQANTEKDTSSNINKEYTRQNNLFFPSLQVGGILQILQYDWFREQAVFYNLSCQPGRNRWQLHSQVCLLFVNEQKSSFSNHFSLKTCAC